MYIHSILDVVDSMLPYSVPTMKFFVLMIFTYFVKGIGDDLHSLALLCIPLTASKLMGRFRGNLAEVSTSAGVHCLLCFDGHMTSSYTAIVQ